MHSRISLDPLDNLLELFLNFIQRFDGNLSPLAQLILPDADPIDKQIDDIVNDGVLIVRFRDEFKHIFIVLLGQIEPNDVETIVEKSRQNTRLRMPLLG
jgi:hypothetical protein